MIVCNTSINKNCKTTQRMWVELTVCHSALSGGRQECWQSSFLTYSSSSLPPFPGPGSPLHSSLLVLPVCPFIRNNRNEIDYKFIIVFLVVHHNMPHQSFCLFCFSYFNWLYSEAELYIFHYVGFTCNKTDLDIQAKPTLR